MVFPNASLGDANKCHNDLYKNTAIEVTSVQTEVIAGVPCLHLRADAEVAGQLALWRVVELPARGKMGQDGACVVAASLLGERGVAEIFSALTGLPAVTIVLNAQDCECGRRLAMSAALRGEVRAIFDELLPAVVWIAARAKALQLARSLPTLEPELQGRRRVRA